jgi:ATPase subunit of ABC transporter with duplicated ATPase domains
VARELPDLPARRVAHDVARSRLHEPHRQPHRGNRRRRDHDVLGQLRLLRTRAHAREANLEAAYARQQAKLAKEQRFIERFAAHAAKAAQVQSRVKALEKIERIELPKKRKVVQFDFRPPPRSGDVWRDRGLSKRYGSRVIYDGFDLTIQRGQRWA